MGARFDQFDLFLHWVKKGDVAGVRRLIESGWDVNAPRGAGGWTPLMMARGNTAIIRLLLAAGAEVNAVTQWDVSALACAAADGRTMAVALLLRAGARVDVQPYGCSFLTYVTMGEGGKHPRILEMLRAAGATALHGNLHLASYPPGFGPVG